MKNILILILLSLSLIVTSQNSVIIIGESASTGTGDVTTEQLNAVIADVNAIEAEMVDTVLLNTIVTVKADTVPIFVFGGGGGNAADTAAFTINTEYGEVKNGKDTLVITRLWGRINTGSGTSTIGVQVYWNDSLNSASATKLNTSAFTINDTIVGNTDISFANNKVPPDYIIWGMTPTISVGNKPSKLIYQIDGYYINGD